MPSDSSKVPVYAGERMSFEDLLYGTMLHSGNDGANAIAYLVGGSVAEFVTMMNDRAAEIGLHGHALFQRPRLSRRHALFHRLRPRPHHPGGHARRDVPSDRLHPHLHHGPHGKSRGLQPHQHRGNGQPGQFVLLRGLHRRQDGLPQPRRPVLRGRAGARGRFPDQRGAGRGAHVGRRGAEVGGHGKALRVRPFPVSALPAHRSVRGLGPQHQHRHHRQRR